MDRHDLYELCVQSPRHLVPFLRAVHGNNPRVLREDFCGTAALSRRWIAELTKAGLDGTATGVDLDEATLARACAEAAKANLTQTLQLVRADATATPVLPADACDIIFVGNFSIGYIHTRAALVNYLRLSRQRLALGNAGFGGGVFVCDTYTGPGTFKEGSVTRTHPGRGHEVVRYTWEQRDADALTAMVTNSIHFQVEIDGEVTERIRDAFVYRWRLWTIPELREAMLEAGFASTEVHQEISEHPEPLGHGRQLKESGIVCVVARM